MSALSILKNVSFLLAILFCLVNSNLYAQNPAPLKFIVKGTIEGNSNNNLIIGTETRRKIEPIEDQALNVSLDLGIDIPVFKTDRFSFIYKVYNENQQNTDFLKRTDHSFISSLRGKLFNKFGYNVEGSFKSYLFRELENLNFNQLSLVTKLHYMFESGITIETQYLFRNRDFTGDNNNVTGYSVIGSNQNTIKFRAKKWLSQYFRAGIEYIYSAERFQSTPSTYLNAISGLSAKGKRQDTYFAIQPEITTLLFDRMILLNVGYQIESNSSNSLYYNYEGFKGLADVVIDLHEDHSFSAEFTYGAYQYPDRQFDKRFTNPKEDFRTTFFLTYNWDVFDFLTWKLTYNYMENDSNDSPFYKQSYSLTYSSFKQSIVGTSFQFNIGRMLKNGEFIR
jgi:hypothetical protein